MMHEFKLPDLGEGLAEAEIVEWHVAPGDVVTEDQVIVEVQTAKAVVEIPSPTAGTVRHLGAQTGEVLAVGATLIAFNRTTDPAAPLRHESTGTTSTTQPVSAPAVTTGTAAPENARPARRRALASPSTRQHAVAQGVELATIHGTGPAGRVTRADVDAAVAARAAERPTTPASESVAASPAPARLASSERNSTYPGGRHAPPAAVDEVVPLRGIRRQIAKTMMASWQEVPHVTEFREVNAASLVETHGLLSKRLTGSAHRLTFMPLMVMACVAALQRHPSLNASLDMQQETITYKRSVNIGIATASPEGLTVPVLRDADRKSLVELANEIGDLASAVRDRSIRPDQLNGGTFTVSNFGSYGTWLGTPIIKPPEVAIAGFGRIRDAVIAVDGQPVVRSVLPVAVSADHRLIDGDVLGAFVNDLAALLENPVLLLGEVR